MSDREVDIQARILAAVTARADSMFWRNNTGSLPNSSGRFVPFGCPGSSDIIGCYRGRFVGIEVKAESGRQSDQQRRFETRLTRAGGLYVLARSVEDVITALREDAIRVLREVAP